MKKYHTLFFTVRAVVETELTTVADAVHELETQSKAIIPDTAKVKVMETEILLTRVRNIKNINHGTPS